VKPRGENTQGYGRQKNGGKDRWDSTPWVIPLLWRLYSDLPVWGGLPALVHVLVPEQSFPRGEWAVQKKIKCLSVRL